MEKCSIGESGFKQQIFSPEQYQRSFEQRNVSCKKKSHICCNKANIITESDLMDPSLFLTKDTMNQACQTNLGNE